MKPINDDARWTHNTSSQIKFKTKTLNSRLCDYRDIYIVVKGTTIVVAQGAGAAEITADKNYKEIMF